MRRIVVKDNQSLFDITIQEYGSMFNVVAFAQVNNISVTHELAAGQTLIVPELLTEQNVLKYYAENNIIPATAQLSDEMQLITLEDAPTMPPCFPPLFSEEFF